MFEKVITKAKDACFNAGEQTQHHFPIIRKVIEAGKRCQHEILND
jgi:DNA-damage-inducible protein D